MLRRGAFAALLAATASVAAANVLVVRSAGPSAGAYPAGRSLPDNASITLRAGDVLVVLAGGGTRTFRGPGTYSPGTAARAGTRTVADNSGRRARIGAVRNAGIVPRSPTIWHVDVSQSGTICLANAGNVMLWRPDATTQTRLTITAPRGGAREVVWPAGAPTLAWPADWSAGGAIASGDVYTFREAGVGVPTRITFRTLDSELSDLQAVAAALIENGCQEQLDVLVETQPDLSAPAG